jgi:hypothetical protein
VRQQWPGHFSFEGSHVRAIDGESTEGIVTCKWAINDLMLVEHFSKEFFIRTAQHTVKAEGGIGLLNLPGSELLLVVRHCV